MINLLKSPIKKYTNIVHIADCHIRLNKRHDEYKEVFANLYEEIKNTPETTLVACLGDVFHSKSDLSPECIQVATDFFKAIADIRPLILVAGNHDATLSNKSRLDSLTPLVDSLNHPNLFYLKTTGLYGFGNILFNNMCVFDDPEKYILGKDIPDIYHNQYEHIIALFHGAVDKASLETGYSISNPAIMNPLFDNHHIALLGDIHKKQDMQDYEPENNKPCIRYCGSLIQQNHGEGLKGHGYSLWDLSDHSYTHHEISNDFGYFTVEVNKGQLTTDLVDLPKKVRLRLKCYESISSEVKTVIAQIKEKAQVVETAYVRMDQEMDKKDIIPLCKDIVLTDLTNVDYQNRLIAEFLQKKAMITDQNKIDEILKINRDTNLLIKKDEFARNLKWKPITMEWSNTFAYGEDNVIDFTQMNGVYGIFGINASGKSSILDTLIFTLFDKTSRCFKGNHVLNVQKTSFKCKLEFEISGIRYFIERKGTTTLSGNVKVDVKFWKVVNGVEEELHGTARRDTNDIIRDYIGTYEDFILTAVSFQNAKNSASFIDMGNSERKDLMVQLIGLNVFDRLYESASERNKELNALLKMHIDKNYSVEIQQNQNALAHSDTMFAEIEKEINSLKKQMSDVNEQIVNETANLIKLDITILTNLPQMEERRKSAEEIIAAKRKFVIDTKESLCKLDKVLVDLNGEILKIEKSNFVECHKIFKNLTDKINEIQQKINLKKVEVKGKLDKKARLDKHEYDPNCKFCINNSFVKDATKSIKELVEDKKDTDKMLKTKEDLCAERAKLEWVEKSYETYTKLLTKRGEIKDKCATHSRNIIVSTNEMERIETAYANVVNQIEVYHRNSVAVEANEKVQSKISSFRNALSRLDSEHQIKTRSLIEVSGKRELFRTQIEALTKIIKDVQALENESEAYQSYLQSVGRDGISYQVICNTAPELEKEVNSILSQVVDYTIQFETDGKNIIPYIVYSDIGKYPIELASGYERFVSSIAIRIGLSEFSNLPKCSYLMIDEGFSTLDPEHLASMSTLFSVIKNYYDFSIVVSHNDTIKDFVDKTIEIIHEGGFAKVVFK